MSIANSQRATAAQRALHRIVTLLAAGRPVLTHCFAGKDRTGFVIATVLEMIGIDRDVIIADYLRSNDSVAQLRERITEVDPTTLGHRSDPGGNEVRRGPVVRRGSRGPRRSTWTRRAKRSTRPSGHWSGYLRDAGITAADIDRLRGALLA